MSCRAGSLKCLYRTRTSCSGHSYYNRNSCIGNIGDLLLFAYRRHQQPRVARPSRVCSRVERNCGTCGNILRYDCRNEQPEQADSSGGAYLGNVLFRLRAEDDPRREESTSACVCRIRACGCRAHPHRFGVGDSRIFQRAHLECIFLYRGVLLLQYVRVYLRAYRCVCAQRLCRI